MITANTSPDALLFNYTIRGPFDPVALCAPVMNPDATQMTLGQFNAASGQSAVKCINRGSHGVFAFSGLRPGGTYTVWILLFPVPGPPAGVGGIGRGSENNFTADANGEGQIGRTTPAGDLSFFGSVGPCLLDSPFAIDLIYHSDQQSHGQVPGALNTIVTNGRFVYP